MTNRTPNPRRRLLAALASAVLAAPGFAGAATTVALDAPTTNVAAKRTYVDLPGFAASRDNTGIAVHDIGDTKLLDAVKDAGFSFVRADLFWEAVDTPHGWDFSKYDTLVANLSARGLGALFILGGMHHLHSPNQPPTTPAQLAAFRQYVFKAAQRFKGKPVRFEVWNEQDHKTYWLGEPSPAAYRNVLKQALQAVKAANPDAIVATGGVQQVNRTFIRAVGDIASRAQPAPDAISVHPYRQTEPETVFADYAALRRDLSSYRTPPQIWATEWAYPSYGYNYVADIGDGHSSVARERQARYAVRLLLANWISQIGLTSYYDIRDDGRDRKNMEHNFGLLDADTGKLPAYIAVRQLFWFTGDAERARYFQDSDARYVVLKLTAARATKYVVWCYGDGNAIGVDLSRLPAGAAVTDMYGAGLDAGSRRRLDVPETRGPIFITIGA
ncbi:cellulase family glycosylhydrolase [Burkholderia oklahomensis]|uniref:cellulase family glycosylhydrolase n=1 Tax=Burkholderia oklahomensis TaxID=342113 RepID=UPI0002F336DF|nr:cellulase family glycosylhydrolase [Burkholderia oklahomensis]AJX35520.1 cellulase family protein [Burkholderia oklahomensis C6786]AOI50122.1 glycosyl hydrolase family 5 [Burkholderia oklahomensis C6786]KUY50237.1 glycosyl hydrolase family 5 [Burkholderia oklahomensis C6786]MBI0363699.1 cellulase family glycosylhydrolase [Burkholderia oklahomensis]SUY27827.1 Beta-xylosidase [Burkholderia oklahomensis]